MCVITAIVLAAAGCTEPSAPPAPLHLAELAPPDVRLYVQLRAAADWRSAVAARPIARCLQTLLTRGQLSEAWGRLADAADLEPAALFDATLGRDVAVFVRGAGDATEWVAVAEAEPDQVDLIIQRLQARVLPPLSQAAMLELPDHELLLARRGGRLVFGPAPGSPLFFEVVPNLGGAEPSRPTLAGVEGIAAAAALGAGRAGIYLRHDPPIGGWSVAVADLQDNRFRLRHAARFEHAPFERPPTEVAWDMAPIEALRNASIVAFIEPSTSGGGPLEAFLQAGLGRPVFDAQLRANLGARRITAISDLDGRLSDPPFDLLLPTFARADEVKDPDAAWPMLDRTLLGLLRRLDEIRGCHEQPLALPDPQQLEARAPRQVAIGPLVAHFLGKFPGADRVTLNWMVQSGPQGHWTIVATGREHMATLAAALAAPPASDFGRWESCGTFDGPRLAEHLRSWRAAAAVLAGPAEMPAVSEGLLLFSQLADGIERGRWRLSRPTAQDALTEIELLLSPPESSEGQGP